MVNLEILKINHKIKVIGPIHLKQKLTNLLKILYGNYFDSFIERNIEFIEISNESYSLSTMSRILYILQPYPSHTSSGPKWFLNTPDK